MVVSNSGVLGGTGPRIAARALISGWGPLFDRPQGKKNGLEPTTRDRMRTERTCLIGQVGDWESHPVRHELEELGLEKEAGRGVGEEEAGYRADD